MRIVLFYVTSVLKSSLTQKVLYREELRIIDGIKQVFQTEPKRETFCLCACMNFGQFFACVQTSPISFSACNKGNRKRLHAGKTVFSLYFAYKTEGREVHDLQRAFGKLNQRFSAKFLRAELNVLNRLVFASHMF